MTSFEKAYAATAAFVESIPKAQRKRYGQFFTSRKSADFLAWETEIWLAEEPEHMIHLNGDKFLGPR